ncbi:8895_t:CDS:2, partial [Funneliformis geosporum]
GGLLIVGTSDTEIPNSSFYTQTGGVIAIIAPDTANLLDNYHELLGILEQVKVSKLGEVNEALNNLRTKTQLFLKRYDKDENRVIDISELIEERKDLATDLNKDREENNEETLETQKLEKSLFEEKEDYQKIDLDEYLEEKMEIAPKGNN